MIILRVFFTRHYNAEGKIYDEYKGMKGEKLEELTACDNALHFF